jgi:preprotein translocase subunit SecG
LRKIFLKKTFTPKFIKQYLILKMEGIQLFLLVFQIILAVLMVILVLIQKSDGDSLSGLGSGSGGLNSAISGRSTMSILSKITMSMATLFMINCLVLASLTKNKSSTISKELNEVIKETEATKNQNSTNINQSSPAENVAPKPSVPAVE